MIDIVPANSGSRLKQFIALPRILYQEMADFAPPLDLERSELLDPKKAAFFRHGEAAYFLALRDGKPVGRISAQVDKRYQAQPDRDDIGLFGCFDLIDDLDVANALLNAAKSWLRARGLRRIQGPFLLDFNGEPGLLVEGQKEPPMILAPWHPKYLHDHLRDLGLRKAKDLHFYTIDLANRDPSVGEKAQRLLSRRTGLTVRDLRLDDPGKEAEITVRLYNDAWSGNWGFVPLESAEIAGILKTLKPLMHSDYGMFVEVNGEPAACTIAVPNVNELVADLGGKPSLLGWLKLAIRFWKKDVASVRIILMGIAAQYRKSPLAAAMLLTMLNEISKRRHNHKLASVEAGWVLEDNIALIKVFNQFGIPVSRTYRLFEAEIM